MFNGEQFTGASEAALHLIRHIDDAVLGANLTDALEEALWRDNEAAFTLHRFNHDGCHHTRINLGDEGIFQTSDAVIHILVFGHARWTAVDIGEWQTKNF